MKMVAFFRRNLFFAFFLIISGQVFAQNGIFDRTGIAQGLQADQVLDWDKVMVAYDAYVEHPYPDNARALLATLPMDRPNEQIGDKSRAIKSIFSVDSFPILYEETIYGDRNSIEIVLRLLNVSDGYFSELLLSTLGQLVRDKPQQFLDVLMVYKDTRAYKDNTYPVWFSGAGYNVHSGAARYNFEKRIEALETVKDPKYAVVKEACIKILRESLKKLPGIAPSQGSKRRR